ncbi:MAG TPA: diphthine--ammonia ligase [Longimicrobiales bacterium]|nr:diphthine--ammonia ligase [Longimicrobiales bacterium]
MLCALGWSGGKDATLALDRAVREGLDVRYLFNIHEGTTGLVRFHGVRRELIARQAEALGLELLEGRTHPADFEAELLRILEILRLRGVEGIVFGNIHLADVRAWYEERTTGRGFRHLEPLWGTAPADAAAELVARGYRARVVSVNLELGRGEWLGRDFDAALLEELRRAEGVDPAGERGEYHTFAYDGPLFRHPVAYAPGSVFEREGHRIQDLLPVGPAGN